MSHVSMAVMAPAPKAKSILQTLFCEAFKCDNSTLCTKAHTQHDAQGHLLTQLVTLSGPDLILTTRRDTDTVTSTYTILPQDENSCLITLSETAQSTTKSRQLNYAFFSLPVVDLILKKRLKRRLSVLKYRIEKGEETC